jgi:hypothetical protein
LIWGFCGGLLVALGPEAGRIGLTSMILVVITASDPRAPADAIGPALLFFGGGRAAAAVLDCSVAPAALSARTHGVGAAVPAARRERAHGVTIHRKPPPVTQALNDIENVLHGAFRARGAAMEAFRVLAEIIERIRLELLALGGCMNALEDAGA